MKVYLDNNATTPLHPEVKRTICDALDNYGNPSSMHALGREARKEIDAARHAVADFIGAQDDEIIFTSGGTEADNMALNAYPHEIITTAIEHPAVLDSAKYLAKQGSKVTFLPVDHYGKVDLMQLDEAITKDTSLVSIIMANNEIGTIQDIAAISQIVHAKGALLHTDAVQAIGKMPVNVKELDVDLLTFSSHKIYGPKGCGVLYVKKKTPFSPLLHGGHQERQLRPATENFLGIVGLGAAVAMRTKEMGDEEPRLRSLKERLQKGIVAAIPDVMVNGHPQDCVAGTLNVSFAGAEGESILLYLDLEGIAVSTGSACASGSLDPSHVILALGLGHEYAHGSVRISLGRENSDKDVDYVLEVLPKVIKKIRDMSSIYRSK